MATAQKPRPRVSRRNVAPEARAPGLAPLDYETLASELLRALRGKRSQVAWSRRLGSTGNVAYSWESGRRFPTAARTFWAMGRAGRDVRAALGGFYRTPPAWLAEAALDTREGVVRLLADLRGRVPIAELAQRSGKSRFSVSRWLSGDAEPRLPDLLRLIEAMSLRVLDFVHALVGAGELPSVRGAWEELSRARRAAYEMPWSHAVLRALELEQYQRSSAHAPGWIARRLGIAPEEEARCLEMLEHTGQIVRRGERYVVAAVQTVDTRQNPEAGRRLKLWWSRVALERLERLEQEEAGLFSYNLFTVSQADYERLRELQLAYFRQLRSIVARSAPAERVVLANLQLFGLDSAEGP
jgi:DNA-binding phage protein